MMEWIVGSLLLLASLGVITLKKAVHASLSFLLVLLLLTSLYINLSAEFIGVVQLLIYAGAILVLFMFVIILFQDSYKRIDEEPEGSSRPLIAIAASTFILAAGWLVYKLRSWDYGTEIAKAQFGTVHDLGLELYTHFFFPFEAAVILFLIALIGSLFLAKK